MRCYSAVLPPKSDGKSQGKGRALAAVADGRISRPLLYSLAQFSLQIQSRFSLVAGCFGSDGLVRTLAVTIGSARLQSYCKGRRNEALESK